MTKKEISLEQHLQRRILSIDELKKVLPELNETDFTDLIYATFLHQKINWGMLSDGWKGFLSSEYKKFLFDWFLIKVQFNPTRFISSSAKVDEESIKKRKCFLCLENLPEEQKGIIFENNSDKENRLIFLCNPAPIFNEHFTVSHIRHIPQSIYENIELMIRLADLCNNEYTVFYNGPKCGASAPDHFHFQVCPADELITEKDFLQHPVKFNSLIENENFQIKYITIDKYLRNVLVLSSNKIETLVKLFHKVYAKLQEINETNSEPMMNVFSLRRNENFLLIIFPREKHRPDYYFAEGDERMLISPGLVDMCGMLVAPLQKDFERINEDLIKNIYSQVTLKIDKFNKLIESLQNISLH